MELYQEILATIWEKNELHIIFPKLTVNTAEIVELECYKMLKQVKSALEEENLTDARRLEKIAEVLHPSGK